MYRNFDKQNNSFFRIVSFIFFLMSFVKVFTLLGDVNNEYLELANTSFDYLKIILVLVLSINILINISNYQVGKFLLFIVWFILLSLYELVVGRYIDFALILLISFGVTSNVKSILKAILYGLLLGVFVEIIGVNTNVIENGIGGARFGETIRYNYGFYGLMIFGRIIRVIAMCHVLSYSKPKLTHMIAVIGLSLFAFLQTGTRSEFYIVILIYAISIIYRLFNLDVFNKYIYIIGSFLLWILPVLSIIFGKLYEKIPMLVNLNQFSTGRFQYSSWLWNTLSPKLLGNRDFKFSNGLHPGDVGYFYNFVDNGWDQLLLIQGIVSTLIVLIIIQYFLYILFKKRCFIELVFMLIIIILFTFSQSIMFDIILNPMLIELAIVWRGKKVNHGKGYFCTG